MPFVSKNQMRWAFSHKKKWAREWADETPDPKALPDHVEKKADLSPTALLAFLEELESIRGA